MKVMVIVKATKESEAGMMPDEKVIAEMAKFKEELVKAGVMLAGEGLHPWALTALMGRRAPLQYRDRQGADAQHSRVFRR
jgi:hypothetical protein